MNRRNPSRTGHTRRGFLRTLGCATALAPALARAAAGAAAKPNIIYLLADDLGYGDLGCFGQKRIKTPRLDQMAAQGMRFTDHYSGSTVCAPSRCCLMTGYHTGHTAIRGNAEVKPEGQKPIPAATVTIPKLLKAAGYATGAVGKWGLGFPGSEGAPNKQGFDFWYGYNCQRHAHSYWPAYLWRNEEKEPVAKGTWSPVLDLLRHANRPHRRLESHRLAPEIQTVQPERRPRRDHGPLRKTPRSRRPDPQGHDRGLHHAVGRGNRRMPRESK